MEGGDGPVSIGGPSLSGYIKPRSSLLTQRWTRNLGLIPLMSLGAYDTSTLGTLAEQSSDPRGRQGGWAWQGALCESGGTGNMRMEVVRLRSASSSSEPVTGRRIRAVSTVRRRVGGASTASSPPIQRARPGRPLGAGRPKCADPCAAARCSPASTPLGCRGRVQQVQGLACRMHAHAHAHSVPTSVDAYFGQPNQEEVRRRRCGAVAGSVARYIAEPRAASAVCSQRGCMPAPHAPHWVQRGVVPASR
jgi:hypothetical protein